MLKKTQGSESNELKVTPEVANLVPFGDVVGCLAIHIKNCRHFTPRINLQQYKLYIRISVNNVVKCTKMYRLSPQNTKYSDDKMQAILKFDEVKYFSVQVPRRQDDTRNNIYLELIQCDTKEKYTVLIGSVQLHLYEVIQKGCFIEEFQILNKNKFICRMVVEFMFSYGNFGFGFSHQLKPLQKIVEPSMFMNIAPPPERTDPLTNVIIPQPIEYPAFLSPDLNVTVGNLTTTSQSDQPSKVRLEKLQQQPRERLEKMKKEYRDLRTWREKALYIEELLAPKLEHNDELEGSNTTSEESEPEETLKVTVKSDISLINKEAEIISSKLLDNDDKTGLTLPTVNQIYLVSPKRDGPTKQRDTSFPSIPNLTITEEEMTLPLEQDQLEASTDRKLSYAHLQPEAKVKHKLSGILKDSSTSENSLNESVKFSNSVDNTYAWLNTNKKGKSVAFSPQGYMAPLLTPEYIEFKPKYQNFNTKDSFDPSLKNTDNKMSVRRKKDQDMSACRRSISSAEVIEQEDQDPPYPAHSETLRPTDKTQPCDLVTSTIKTIDTKKELTHDPDILTIKALDTEDNLACDPSVTTIDSVDINNKLKERLPNLSLPNLEGESSPAGNVNANICRFSKSLSFTSHIEKLQQLVVLKSILSKNLQDLSGKLFSKPEAPMDTEARKESPSSLLLSVHDKPSSLENKIFEKLQDLNSQISKVDILNSKSLVNQIIKDIPAISLSEGETGNSPGVEKELVSEKHLEVGEIASPVKKSSFKKKHLESDIPSSEAGFSDTARDYVIKQLFTSPAFSKLGVEVEERSEPWMNWQNQLPTTWESVSSDSQVCHEEKDEIELPETESVTSQIMQAFPIDTLLESGVIKVIELDKEHLKSSLLDTETTFAAEKSNDSIEDYTEVKSETDSLSKQNIPIVPKETTSLNGVEFLDRDQNVAPQDPKYPSTPDEKTDLPSSGERLNKEENDLNSALENLSNFLIGKLNEPDVTILKSFFKNIFNVFLKYNQSEKRKPEKELERLIQHPFPHNAEDLERIKENFDKADKLDRKPSLNPKLRVFLEALSESEIKNLKSELSKHIQHYLVETLSESGHITKEDLPKIYQNLYLMNERAEPKEQNVFLEKYSETVKETMSFVNNFNHHFINKHLEIKLRSFLNEILQNYFLKNLSESSLFKETESEPMHSSISSLRTKSASVSSHKLGQDIAKGSFGKRLEINMKYPLNKSLENCLNALSENELLNLKADLSKYLQRLFIEKLSKSGLITESQLEGISNHINLINSSSTSLKYIKPDLSFRDENQFMEEHSEKQNIYSEIVHKATLPKVTKNRVVDTELTRKEEKEHFPLQNIKENPSIITKQKRCYLQEGDQTLTVIKVQPVSNKNNQAVSLKKSLEQLTDTVLKKQKKKHGFVQLQAENFDFKTEIQDPHSWSGKSKITEANICFERTLKMKSLGKKEHDSVYNLGVQEKPEAMLSPYPRIPYCKNPNEDEGYISKFTFPSRQSNTLIHFNLEAGENSKLEDQIYQRLKGYNNNNKKQHLVTFVHYKKEIQALYIKPNEINNEKFDKALESQSSKVVEAEKSSKPSPFPEVLKRENIKPKVQKERDHVNKQKKSPKVVKILPNTQPTVRKSIPRTLLHWTARTTIHDCSDRFEDSPMTSSQRLEKLKPRARLLGKSPDDSHDRLKHSARPYTAPEVNKRRESYTGKFTSPRMVSAGLVYLNDTTPNHDVHKAQPKKMFAHV